MRIKKHTLKSGIRVKAKDYNLTHCKICKCKLFSMEYLYNNGICNPCIGNGKSK